MFKRISILVFSLITILGLLFILLTYFATTHYHQASTQLLNREVAAHIAEFTSPFENDGINKRKADSVFHDAMVISPSAEVYFLDTTGKVIAYHAKEEEIKLQNISLDNIKKYLASQGQEYIKSQDPKDPSDPKIFSAAEVIGKRRKLGYIYVILGSNAYESIMDLLFSSHSSNLAIRTFVIIILLSIIISAVYLNRIKKSFNRMIAVLEKFEHGDYNARFEIKNQDEFTPVKHAFNKMAVLLSSTINSLTKSEKERKDFIANISHDLRTPLSIARGYTETLLIKKEGQEIGIEQRQEYMHLILNKIQQVEIMVKQLFEISKMEAVEFEPHKEPFVISEIAQETVNTFQLIAEEKKITLECTQCVYHVWVNADIGLMERVIQNLIDNAVKSTPEEGSIQVSIVVDNKDLIFQIENTGNLLPEDLLQWINDYKGDGNLFNNRPAKLGLGLLIVQKILHMHGSSLKAKAQNGASNIFSFRLPIVDPVSKERI
ncbi:MAG: ATP-binding protein [Chitinophagaceae bacterium]